MKILLIQPPIRDFYQTSIRTEPIGLAYLAASLRKDGHEVRILDCQRGKKSSVPLPSELSYLKDFYPFHDRSPFKLYTGFYHFGLGWEEIRKTIEASKADVFGISSSFTPYHGEALEIARMIKEGGRGRTVVMGGAHASCDPEGVLKSPFVDYALLGEGEIRFPLLLEKLERGRTGGVGEIEGIAFRRDGETRVHSPRNFIYELDSLPYPARDLLDADRYRIGKRRSTKIITSRGCPHRCTYCSAHLTMGGTFRSRSPEAVVKEMVDCRDRFGTEVFDIEDDNFTFHQDRAKRLMKGIVDAFGEGKLKLTAMNGISFASLDGELLRLMKRAGFDTVNLSLVSTFPGTLSGTGRPEARLGFEEVIDEAERSGLRGVVYAILGMPDQTIEEMVDTLIYLMGRRILIGPSIYYPTPGSPLFERCKERGLLPVHPAQWRSTALPIQTEKFDRVDLSTLLRLARTLNFIKGKMDEEELEEGMTWRQLVRALKERRRKDKIEDQEKAKPTVKFRVQERDGSRWKELILLIFDERSFFSLRREPNREDLVLKMKSSKRVLHYFFEKAWERPVLKTHV